MGTLASGAATPLCPRCLGEIADLDARCPHCGGFVTSRSATLPFEASIGEWWVIGDLATAKRPTLVHLIGAWLLLLPPSLLALWMIVPGAREAAAGTGALGLLPLVLPSAILAGMAYLLYRITRNYRRGRRASPGVSEPTGPAERE